MANEFKIKNGYLSEGNSQITGSLNVSAGITGSLFGTSSFAITASHALNLSPTATASYATQALSASYATTASYVQNAQSASYVLQALSASYAANGGVTQLLAGPNVTLSPTNGLGQVTVSATLSGSTIFNTATGSYGSFYDTTTQTNPIADVPRSMSFNSTDITNGVSISGSTNPFNTYIKTQNAGVYNIQFSAQVDKTDSGADEIVIWLRKNGTDLTDTATTLTLSGNNDKQVAAWNWFVTSATGDYYQIIWRSLDTDLRLLAEPISATHPGIPSVIATVNRVDQFLSNTGSFSGSFTGAFTGSLLGTASYATQALSASWAPGGGASFPYTGSARITGSLDVIGTTTITGSLFVSQSLDTSNRLLYDLNSIQSVDWTGRALSDSSTQTSVDWENRILYDLYGNEVLLYNSPANGYKIISRTYYLSYLGSQVQEDFTNVPFGGKVNFEGEVIEGVLDGTVVGHDLVYLSSSGTWFPLTQGTDQCAKLLGICVEVTKGYVLLEGSLTVSSNISATDSPFVQGLAAGLPIYIKDGSGTYMSTSSPSTGGQYIRVLGHAYYNSTTYTDYWTMKFRPSMDWYKI
jgi:hypothetical protein